MSTNEGWAEHAVHGEFAPLSAEARAMTAEDFAHKYRAEVGVRFPGATYKIVSAGTADYYWRRDDGSYDGWGCAAPAGGLSVDKQEPR